MGFPTQELLLDMEVYGGIEVIDRIAGASWPSPEVEVEVEVRSQ